MARYVFDAETDGLLDVVTRMWIIYFYDLDTGKMQYFLEGDFGWKDVLDNAELIIGHNILAFDLPMLTKVYDYKLPDTVRKHDSLILSQVLDYRRFGYQAMDWHPGVNSLINLRLSTRTGHNIVKRCEYAVKQM